MRLSMQRLSASLAVMAIPALLGNATVASAEIKTRVVEYSQGGTPLQGFIAWDDATTAKRPGILVVHEWWGHNEHARNQAKRFAAAGYVAMALDMFGKGKVTTHPDEAMKFMTEANKDPAARTARFNAALAELKKDPHVDPEKIGAVGYCYGGNVVLSQARTGADLDAVASFHGALGGLPPAAPGQVKARVLVLTGGADSMVPPDQVEAFKRDMTAAHANFNVIVYPGAKHSFTNPAADSVGMPELAYNADADTQSFAEAIKMFGEVFK